MSGFEDDPTFHVISGYGADQGFTEEEAYALLAGLDSSSSTAIMPMIAAYDEDQLRGDNGRWILQRGGSSIGDASSILNRLKKAKDGKSALKSAGSVSDQAKKEPLRGAATVYYQDESTRINAPLRNGMALAPRADMAAKTLDRMFAESKLSNDVRVHRSIARPEMVFGTAWNQQSSNVGLTWRDNAFISTSSDEKIAEALVRGRNATSASMVLMEIIAPKGTPALHIDIGKWSDEKEILFGRGQTYRVIKDDGPVSPGMIRRIAVEIIPNSITTASFDPVADSELSSVSEEYAQYDRLVDEGPQVEIIKHVLMTAAVNSDGEEHTGAMVALVPSDADIERLMVEDGEPADQLHLTLMFLGEAADISENARQKIISAVEKYASDTPMEALGFSVNVFNPMESNSCIVLGVGNDDGSLQALQSNVSSALGGLSGITIPDQHTPWVPHVTLAYTDEFDNVEELGTRTGPITFDKIRVAFGSELYDIPLGEPMTAGFFRKWKESEHPRDKKDGRFVDDVGVSFDKLPADLMKRINAITKASEIGIPKTNVKSFKKIDDGEARQAQEEMFKRAGRKWTPAEEDSLNTYTHNSYMEINGTMRGDQRVATLGNTLGAADIQSAMMPSPISFITKRATHGLGGLEADSLNDLKKLIGAKIRDRAFFSTSYGAKEEHSFKNRKFDLEIEVPEGTPVAFVSKVSARPNELEALLAAGTVFELIDASELKPGQFHLKLRVVPDPMVTTASVDEFAERDVNAPGGGHSLRNYWTKGEGAVKIGWGTDGSFDRCVTHLSEHVRDPQGLCAEYHKAATGEWPAEKGVESSMTDVVVAHGGKSHNQKDHGNRGVSTRSGSAKSEIKDFVQRLRDAGSREQIVKRIRDLDRDELGDISDELGIDEDSISGSRRQIAEQLADHIMGKRKKREAPSTASVVLTASQKVATSEDEPWEGVLTVEGEESGDSRLFGHGSLDWAELPMPLMYQPASVGGHDASVLAGAITFAARKDNTILGRGHVFGNMLDGEHGDGIRNMMKTGGVSVDVDKVKDADVEMVFAEDEGGPNILAKPELTVFHRGRIRGATLVAFPAFVEAKLAFTNTEMTTASASTCACEEEGTYVLTAASHTITIPDVPPAEWFAEPTDVQAKGALTITDEGRVFGWLAPAGVTHRSVRKTVPMGGNVDYTRFMKGETIVAGGGRVVSGVVTGNCGHADTENYGTLANRKKHYDDSCSIFANIAVGQRPGKGVWVAGALRHGVTAEQVAAAMGCTLSGDWQPHPDKPGVQEFIAALLVPVPGFAMARTQASVGTQASVLYQDGVLTAAAIPVQFGEEVKRSEIEIAQDLIDEFKTMLLASVEFDPQSRKDAAMAELEME